MDEETLKKEKIDFLFKVLGRYDHYLGTVNVKSAAILTFHTTVLFGLSLRLAYLFTNNKQEMDTVYSLGQPYFWLSLTIILSMVTIGFIIRPLSPDTTPGVQKSLVFYGDVSRRISQQYINEMEHADIDKLWKDLADQVNVVARIVNNKFKALKLAMQLTTFGVLPSLFLSFIISVRAFS